MASFALAARRVMDDPGAVLEPQCITSACAAAGHRWRTRVLDPVLTVLAMAVQVMHANAAIAHVVRLMHACFSESAFCQARARLPLKVLTMLLELMTQGLRARLSSRGASEGAGLWRGHRTLLIDGSGISMPDTPALANCFGYPANIHEGCGFPVAHLLAVFDLSSGLLLHALAAPWCVGDATMAARAHGLLEEGDVLVGDRNFGSYGQIAALLARGVHGVVSAQRQPRAGDAGDQACQPHARAGAAADAAGGAAGAGGRVSRVDAHRPAPGVAHARGVSRLPAHAAGAAGPLPRGAAGLADPRRDAGDLAAGPRALPRGRDRASVRGPLVHREQPALPQAHDGHERAALARAWRACTRRWRSSRWCTTWCAW